MNLELDNQKNQKVSDNFSKELNSYIEKTNTNFSIDRFEGDIAVCENLSTGEFINISRNLLPVDCKEGSILKFENNCYVLDIQKTNEKQKEIKKLVDNLFKKN